MVKFKDISIFFMSSCCNKKGKEKSDKTENRGSLLGEPLPKFWKKIIKAIDNPGRELHECTITFTNKMLRLNLLVIHNMLRGYVERYAKRVKKKHNIKFSYIMVPEFSKTGRLHFHAVLYSEGYEIHIHDFKHRVRNKFGNTEGKMINNKQKWFDYISKDLEKDYGGIQMYHNLLLSKDEPNSQENF